MRLLLIMALLLCGSVLPGALMQSTGAVTASADVTLTFAGDVHFEGAVKRHLSPHGLDSLKPLFAHDDFSMVNLETSIGNHGKPELKRYTFQTSPMAFQALANAGVDAVTMANNHAVDYGQLGLSDTLAGISHSAIPVLGIGKNISSALTPLHLTIKGQNLSVFAFVGLDLEGATAFTWPATKSRAGVAVWANHKNLITGAVRREKSAGRTVIVFVHWGAEEHNCPTAQQTGVADDLVKAGAEVIVGAHPHVLEGVGRLHGALVAYSLGNFVWYSHAGVPTGVLRVTLRAGRVISYRIDPATYGPDGIAHLATGSTKRAIANIVKSRTACTNLKNS
mgnify:CR=1 FL=1